LQYFRIRKLAQGKQFDLSPIQRRHLEISSSPNVIFEHCVTALNKLQAVIVKKDMIEYCLKAQIGNHNTINVIRIDIVPMENSHSQIKIICHPFFWVAINDNGYNYQDVEKLLSYLNAEGSQQV